MKTRKELRRRLRKKAIKLQNSSLRKLTMDEAMRSVRDVQDNVSE